MRILKVPGSDCVTDCRAFDVSNVSRGSTGTSRIISREANIHSALWPRGAAADPRQGATIVQCPMRFHLKAQNGEYYLYPLGFEAPQDTLAYWQAFRFGSAKKDHRTNSYGTYKIPDWANEIDTDQYNRFANGEGYPQSFRQWSQR